MKRLSDYINNIDFVIEQLDKYCLIHEAFDKNNHVYYTFESIGLFKGCKEIINYIANNIQFKPREEYYIKASDITNNLFFDELRLYTSNKGDDFYGAYKTGYEDEDKDIKYHQKQWNYEKQKFNFIEITLYNIKNANDNDIYEILTHELNHAWDDYILNKTHGTTLRDKRLDNKFEQEVKKLSENIKLNKWLDFKNQDKYNEYLNNDIPYLNTILYYLDKTEQNSYIAQVNQVLKNKHFEKTSELVNYLNNNCITYCNYKTIYELFNNDDYINKLIDLGLKKSSINYFKKIANKTWNKVINHIYHILIDNQSSSIKENIFLRIDDLMKPIWVR